MVRNWKTLSQHKHAGKSAVELRVLVRKRQIKASKNAKNLLCIRIDLVSCGIRTQTRLQNFKSNVSMRGPPKNKTKNDTVPRPGQKPEAYLGDAVFERTPRSPAHNMQRRNSQELQNLWNSSPPTLKNGGLLAFQKELPTPRKINGWNIIPWRFGSDHFPFQMGDL